jgi:hypothetical protein
MGQLNPNWHLEAFGAFYTPFWAAYDMLLKIEILFIPLLANSHIFEISEDDHPRLVTDARAH